MIAVEKEILITLAGALVIVLITIFQIWAMSRAKSKHHQKMLVLGNSLKAGDSINMEQQLSCHKKSCSLFCNIRHLLQIIFGVLVFVSFTCWAVYLVSVGFIEWAPLPGSLALIGLATPIIAWRGYKHRHQAMNRLTHDIESSQKTAAQEGKHAVAQPVIVEPAPVEPEIAAIPEPVLQTVSAPPSPVVPEKPAVIRAKPVVIEKQKLPQDSILKRHFLTHLRTQVESLYPPRPTDSTLKRHFDNFIAAEMEKYVEAPIEPAVADKAAVKTAEPALNVATVGAIEPTNSGIVQLQKQKLPQDSILKRHFLTQLHFDIEAGLPPRPTDSILKRHYDNLIMTEMAKRLEQMEA